MLEKGKKSRQYFVPPNNSFSLCWRIKSEEEYSLETGNRPKDTRLEVVREIGDLKYHVRREIGDLDTMLQGE